jgi:hypothetical protein
MRSHTDGRGRGRRGKWDEEEGDGRTRGWEDMTLAKVELFGVPIGVRV